MPNHPKCEYRPPCPRCKHAYVVKNQYCTEFKRKKTSWSCNQSDIDLFYRQYDTCEECGKAWDGSEVWTWAQREEGYHSLSWDKQWKSVDMDKLETEWGVYNGIVRARVKQKMVECESCGKRWKNKAALRTDQRKCTVIR